MFSKILIANRGEIALRVLRSCKELGIRTVAVYSEADRDAIYLKLADEKYCIGPAAPAQSYLSIANIIAAAEVSDVDAIHPGYGFLSENAHFAEVCKSCGIEFIGPSPDAMRMLGNKVNAREIAMSVGVPTIPGSKGAVESEEEAKKVADQIGFPILIKARSGGGGRGMRVVRNKIGLLNAYHAARGEAETAFKDSGVYFERYIGAPRHVEIQILGDKHGNIVYLGERDCSVQRRHQKLIEESPSPCVSDEMRKRMGEDAVKLCNAAGYSGAGTVEFLVDENFNYFFIEVNTRIQVEHPVTEMLTGVDIVKQQIRVAAGERLDLTQDQVRLEGHAIECRINAEDPNDFTPSPGKITHFFRPGGSGVRVDSHCYTGFTISPRYDSLIAKLIVRRRTRLDAINTMRVALEEFIVEGVKTTIPLHREILATPAFLDGNVDTHWLEGHMAKRS